MPPHSHRNNLAERAIQTIKSRFEKIFDKRGERRWIDVLDDVIANYNKTPHRSIGMAPLDVNDENRDEVYKRLYPKSGVTVVCNLKIGDKVKQCTLTACALTFRRDSYRNSRET